MGKGPGLYTDIGKKASDLLYKDYQSDHKFTITTYSPTGVVAILGWQEIDDRLSAQPYCLVDFHTTY